MTRNDILQKLKDDTIRQVALEHQMTGVRKMYDASVLMGDNVGAERLRTDLHTLLDMQLDIVSTTMALTRALAGHQ